MIKQFSRPLLRTILPTPRSLPPKRLISTAPPSQKSRSWKSGAARWGLAIGIVYYYNTSNLFAEEPAFSVPPPSDEISIPTLESIALSREQSTARPTPTPSLPPSQSSTQSSPLTAQAEQPFDTTEEEEEEASQEGAFNEETGEINWGCPCLGGMADGPCGEQFRQAFSCFVFSKEEPKGMDCIENFKTMQNCFRDHPETYGAELSDEDSDPDSPPPSPDPSPDIDEPPPQVPSESPPQSTAPPSSTNPTATSSNLPPPLSLSSSSSSSPSVETANDPQLHAKQAKDQVDHDHGASADESEALVPKAAHDARQ